MTAKPPRVDVETRMAVQDLLVDQAALLDAGRCQEWKGNLMLFRSRGDGGRYDRFRGR
jgi:hypothetical protein